MAKRKKSATAYKPKFEEGTFHPLGKPRGIGEQLFRKAVGVIPNTFMPEDDIYMEQFMHPDVDILPKQHLRPTKMNIPEGEVVRHPHRFPTEASYLGTSPSKINTEGLGSWQQTQGPGYTSLYDKWDFDTNSVLAADETGGGVPYDERPLSARVMERIGKAALGSIGQPYHVYERVPDVPNDPDGYPGAPKPTAVNSPEWMATQGYPSAKYYKSPYAFKGGLSFMEKQEKRQQRGRAWSPE